MPWTLTWLPSSGEAVGAGDEGLREQLGGVAACRHPRQQGPAMRAVSHQLALATCLAPPSRRKANPQAFGNVLRRMLEAAGRGMWNADPQTLQQLQEMYAELDDELEGIKRN